MTSSDEEASSKWETPNLKRVFYDFKDFHLRLDDRSPVHYDIGVNKLDSEGKKWAQVFRIYGTDRNGRLMVYERRWVHSYTQTLHRGQMVEEFIKNYAEPLNAVPGRIEIK